MDYNQVEVTLHGFFLHSHDDFIMHLHNFLNNENDLIKIYEEIWK